MRNLHIMAHISLDGVIQAPGGPDEDRSNGFAHGGWVTPFADPEVGRVVVQSLSGELDLLLGRHTYDIWAQHWPDQSGPLADSLNAATKFVTTHRPESLQWGPAIALGGEVMQAIRAVKEQEGPDLILWGSSTLTPLLLEHGLADRVTLLIAPIFLGQGKRLFREGTPPRELALLESKAVASGVLINSYKPGGAIRTGLFGDA
ncbi:MAG: dihydrofolate reductase family protein [Planctomycetota bacterium]